MKAEIISTGEELVLGATVDTNSAWLSLRLAELGVPVLRHVTVGDDQADITAALREACARADVVLLTGGLGPTADDLAREALAALVGRPLVTSAESLQQIRDRFTSMGRAMPPENSVQALHPEGTEPIPNSCGTAPGIHCIVRTGDHLARLFAMPGVPREMFVMFDASVRPHLQPPPGAGRYMLSRTLNCFGAGESVIGERIRHLMKRGRNPSVGTNVREMIIKLRVTAVAGSAEEVRRLVDADLAEIRAVTAPLGEIIFGQDDETMESAVAALLRAKGKTVATAESCTGGLLGGMLTNVAGISAYFWEGVITYSNAAKVRLLGVPEETIQAHGAVSPQTAEAMAAGCRARSGADYALSVTGIAGPGGGSPEKPVGLVYLGVADANGVSHHRVQFLGERDQIRERAAKAALNLLRLKLLKL